MSMPPETPETIIKDKWPRKEADDNAGEGQLKHSEIQKTHHARLVHAAELVQLGLCTDFLS